MYLATLAGAIAAVVGLLWGLAAAVAVLRSMQRSLEALGTALTTPSDALPDELENGLEALTKRVQALESAAQLEQVRWADFLTQFKTISNRITGSIGGKSKKSARGDEESELELEEVSGGDARASRARGVPPVYESVAAGYRGQGFAPAPVAALPPMRIGKDR